MKKICIAVLLLMFLCSCSGINDGDVIVPEASPSVPYITNSGYENLQQLYEVEITNENFDDYFSFTMIENPVDVFGNPLPSTQYDYYVITSRIYEDGLIFYDESDTAVEILCGESTITAGGFYIRFSCGKGVVPQLKSVRGSCTFADKSFAEEYVVQDGYRCVKFADGKISKEESRDIMALYPY